MIDIQTIMKSISDKIRLDPIPNGAYQVVAPFFHEDGDMLDIFIRENENQLQICDFGATLMRLSYNFDINTENKHNILSKILNNNGIEDSNGNFILNTNIKTFFADLLQYQMAITKVSNMDILKKNILQACFLSILVVSLLMI